MPDQSDLINRLAEAAMEVRAVLTEARQTIKDMRAAEKNAKVFIHQEVMEVIQREIANQLAAAGTEIGEKVIEVNNKIDSTTHALVKEYDKLNRIITSTTTLAESIAAERKITLPKLTVKDKEL